MGVNTVGRCKTAVVNIKNLVIFLNLPYNVILGSYHEFVFLECQPKSSTISTSRCKATLPRRYELIKWNLFGNHKTDTI